MKLFIFLALLTVLLATPRLLNSLSPVIFQLHEICFTLRSQNISQPEIWNALVCGENLSSKSSMKSQLIFTQLIHIIVVSGAHFIVLSAGLNYLRLPLTLKIILLLLFAFATGLQPPTVRGLLAIGLSHYSFKYKVLPHGDQRSLFVLFLSLLLEPLWINSWSFFLSSLCALALSFKLSSVSSHSKVFLLLIPLETLWNAANPLGLLTNYLLADFIGGVLFPLALLSIIPFYFFSGPFNLLTELFLQFLSIFDSEFNFISQNKFSFSADVPVQFWIYLFLIYGIIHFFRLKRFESNTARIQI